MQIVKLLIHNKLLKESISTFFPFYLLFRNKNRQASIYEGKSIQWPPKKPEETRSSSPSQPYKPISENHAAVSWPPKPKEDPNGQLKAEIAQLQAEVKRIEGRINKSNPLIAMHFKSVHEIDKQLPEDFSSMKLDVETERLLLTYKKHNLTLQRSSYV